MRGLLAKSPIDGFVLSIMLAVIIAAFLPARGTLADVLDYLVIALIALLFFLYGTRLSPREALEGLTHWRLHLIILAFTFVLFPIVGVILAPLLKHVIGQDLSAGMLYLTLVPSTVQSSIAFTSIARGNVPGAIVSASVSNLLGVFLTPLLVVWLMSTDAGVQFDASSITKIMLQILLPFVVGQVLRRWVAPVLSRYAEPTKYVDRGAIVLVVYVAFSEGVRNGLWSLVDVWQVLIMLAIATALVVVMLVLSGWLPKRLGFDREDTIAIQFCGTKKSLATGLPMATVLFSGSSVGLIVLPLMIFHQVQLIMCSWLATRYAARSGSGAESSGA